MRLSLLCFAVLLALCGAFAQKPASPVPMDADVTQGALRIRNADGGLLECPLTHTAVTAEISGFIARVKVTQTFYNPADDKIEAVYVFPLPNTAAVDNMTMVIGDRRIVGLIKKRAQARQLYEEALRMGATASLLEQERPNIFTQSVGNIKPKQEVRIEITYIDVLKYDLGTYEFHFPMVVGPRYMLGAASGKQGTGWSPDTDRVPDASRISPPVLKPGQRNGHDISLSLTLDAGVPIRAIHTSTHKSHITPVGDVGAKVMLRPDDAIPNKDFILRYQVAGKQPAMALLANKPTSGDGYFMLMIQPKVDESLLTSPPREMVFLVDVSGSMMGAPTEKVKQTMREFFKRSRPDDTIQVITFYSDSHKLFEKAVPATEENVARALNFTDGVRAGGGTEMLKGVRMAINDPLDEKRARIIVMLTDGYIGNEQEIIDEVGKRAGDRLRFWTLGIGSSPNRMLLDGVAKQGGGKSAVIDLNTDPSQTVGEAVERIHKAQLAKIKLDWGGLGVYDVLPRAIPDLWAGAPVVLYGKYADGGAATITASGFVDGKPVTFDVDVTLPHSDYAGHDVLPQVWARQKIDDLTDMMVDADDTAVIDEITQLALDYHLMSQYTSLVAVDESEIDKQTNPATPPRRVAVPVPLPNGVQYEGIFGDTFGVSDDLNIDGTLGSDLSSHPTLSGIKRHILSSNEVQMKLRGPQGPTMTYAYTAPAPSTAPMAMAPGKPSSGSGRAGAKGAPQPMTIAPNFSTTPASPTATLGDSSTEIGISYLDVDAEDVFARENIPAYVERDADARKLLTPLPKAVESAATLLKDADALLKASKPEEALLKAQYAVFLLRAARAPITPKVIDVVTTARQACVTANEKALPGLGKTLTLVIRNQALDAVLPRIAAESGVKIELEAGTEDALALLGANALSITYLDLRGATVSQALEWALTPLKLTWHVQEGRVVVKSARQMDGVSAWAYDVRALTTPTAAELKDPARAKAAADVLTAILQAVRTEVGQQGNDPLTPRTAFYLTTAYLIVYGNREDHAKAGELLAALRAAMPPLKGYEGLQTTTSARAAEMAKVLAERQGHAARAELIVSLRDCSWPLLADAYRSQCNTEALTYLQAAWTSPHLETVLTGPYRLLALRSAWALTQAARRLPADTELNILARQAYSKTGGQLPALTTALAEKPDDLMRYVCLLYATLTAKTTLEGAGAPHWPISAAEKLLTGAKESDPYRVVARALLAPSPADAATLAALCRDGKLQDENMVILGIQAAAQFRGDTWQSVRLNLPKLLGGPRLSGEVVILANRMASRFEQEWAKK